MKLNNDQMILLYRNLVRTRKADELIVRGLAEGKVLSFYHSSQGEEAVPVGCCTFLRDDDYVTLTHRGHGIGYFLSKGGALKEFVAEHYGKATGSTKGITGWHSLDPEKGMLGYSGIIGSAFSISVGWGLAAKKHGKQQVAVCFFGDGTSNRGTLHEAMNMASLWKLPILYVCQNNGLAQHMPIEDAYPKKDIAELGAGYNIPSVVVDGQDVLAVHDACQTAVERARAGEGPSLIECKTCRYRSHSEGIPDAVHYTERTREEIEALKNRDPIILFQNKLLEKGVLSQADVERIDGEVDTEMKEAEKFAADSPFPDPKILEEVLYAE